MQVREVLWPRVVAWARSMLLTQDMSAEWSCCGAPMLAPAEMSLGETGPYELWMNTCSHCGGRWMNVHTVPWTIARWKPVAREDVDALLAASPGSQRQAVLDRWIRRHLSHG